jgi:hypothetical protein
MALASLASWARSHELALVLLATHAALVAPCEGLVAPSCVLARLSALGWRAPLRLRSVIFSVFTEANCNPLGSVRKAVAHRAAHGVGGTLLASVVHESDSLAVLVPSDAHLGEPLERGESLLKFFPCHIGGDVAHVQ